MKKLKSKKFKIGKLGKLKPNVKYNITLENENVFHKHPCIDKSNNLLFMCSDLSEFEPYQTSFTRDEIINKILKFDKNINYTLLTPLKLSEIKFTEVK